MEAIILVGLPASGKSTYCKANFSNTHIRLNLDMLKTRHREKLLINACIAAKQPFVIDNTNVTVLERKRYIDLLKNSKFKIMCHVFVLDLETCLITNRQRVGPIPDVGILSKYKEFQFPTIDEGFTEIGVINRGTE